MKQPPYGSTHWKNTMHGVKYFKQADGIVYMWAYNQWNETVYNHLGGFNYV